MEQFTNQAALLYNGITELSNIVTGEIRQALTVWKDSTTDNYNEGDILTYVVSMQNSGTFPLNNLTLTDNLGAYTFGTGTLVPLTYTGEPVLYYINGILQTAPTATAGPPFVINGINVPVGLSAIIVYRVRVNAFARLGTGATIDNTVTISGTGLTSNITATETVTMSSDPVLSIIKGANPTSVIENQQIVYTFTICNFGAVAADASAGIVISDTFRPILSGLSVTLNGVTWPSLGNYNYNTVTGILSTVAGQITVPAATYSQNPITGQWSTIPGKTVLTVSGTVQPL